MTTPAMPLMPYSVQYVVGTGWWAEIPPGQRNSSSYSARHHRLSPGTYRIQWSWKSEVGYRPNYGRPSGGEQGAWTGSGTSRLETVSVPPGSWLELGMYLNPSGANPDTDFGVLWVYPMETYET